MPATFYGLTSCDTCRAALKAIAAGGINIDRKDVRAHGVPADILSQLIDAHELEKFETCTNQCKLFFNDFL